MLVGMCSLLFYSTIVYQLPKDPNLATAVQVLDPLLPSLVRASEILMPSAHFITCQVISQPYLDILCNASRCNVIRGFCISLIVASDNHLPGAIVLAKLRSENRFFAVISSCC